jgi:vacuolar-type H+-ATPase subunit I/STV1
MKNKIIHIILYALAIIIPIVLIINLKSDDMDDANSSVESVSTGYDTIQVSDQSGLVLADSVLHVIVEGKNQKKELENELQKKEKTISKLKSENNKSQEVIISKKVLPNNSYVLEKMDSLEKCNQLLKEETNLLKTEIENLKNSKN